MKNLLPTKGFTLIELLVVIVIIAILFVIGIALMRNLGRNARDAQRRSDINTIAKAMEANYNLVTGRYQNLQAPWFTSGTIPIDPLCTDVGFPPCSAYPGSQNVNGRCISCSNSSCSNGRCMYCSRGSNTSQVTALCPATGGQIVRANFPTNAVSPAPVNQYWSVCTNLEGGGFYCQGNRQ